MWIYQCHVLSRKGNWITRSTRALSDLEYEIPEMRDIAEQMAKEALRRIEGVTLETPIEDDGWRHIEPKDEYA